MKLLPGIYGCANLLGETRPLPHQTAAQSLLLYHNVRSLGRVFTRSVARLCPCRLNLSPVLVAEEVSPGNEKQWLDYSHGTLAVSASRRLHESQEYVVLLLSALMC